MSGKQYYNHIVAVVSQNWHSNNLPYCGGIVTVAFPTHLKRTLIPAFQWRNASYILLITNYIIDNNWWFEIKNQNQRIKLSHYLDISQSMINQRSHKLSQCQCWSEIQFWLCWFQLSDDQVDERKENEIENEINEILGSKEPDADLLLAEYDSDTEKDDR